MSIITNKLKVISQIIRPVFNTLKSHPFVMNNLPSMKATTKRLCHYKTMFKNFTSLCHRIKEIIGIQPNKNITIVCSVAFLSSPRIMSFSRWHIAMLVFVPVMVALTTKLCLKIRNQFVFSYKALMSATRTFSENQLLIIFQTNIRRLYYLTQSIHIYILPYEKEKYKGFDIYARGLI